MTAPDTPPARYGRLRATLHWLIALAILVMLAMGFLGIAPLADSDPDKVAIVRLHLIIGLAIAAMLLVSVSLAYLRRAQAALPSGSGALDGLAKVTHHALRLVAVATVASGIATSALAGIPAVVFGGVADRLPVVAELVPFHAHALLAIALALLFALHVAGALFHALVRRDGIFARMSPFRPRV